MWKRFTYSLLFVLVFASAQAQSNGKLGEADYVKVYPNPVVSEAIIKIIDSVDLERHKVSITFYNIVGKEVQKFSNLKDSEVRFSRENLASGIYIYQLKVDDRTQSTGRITIK